MKFFTFLLGVLISGVTIAQQGVVEGQVIDAATGNPVAGTTVQVAGEKAQYVSNQEGRFSISLAAGKVHSITVSSVGFSTKAIDDVQVEKDQVISLTIALERKAKEEEAVVVRASARRETVNAMIVFQKNTNTVAQVVSAEAIKRSPDRNTGEVLKRVPGTSVQEGKYLIVRGLADRYNQAMLNGVLLSSTEPDRKTFSFDLFPSTIIENIVINKAFIPELPGEWAGGLVQVNTKDVPSKGFMNFQIGTGFNTATIGNDFYTYRGGKTDFLGFDDGTRSIPNALPVKSTFNQLSTAQKTELGKQFKNIWTANPLNNGLAGVLNQSIQINGGFKKSFGKRNSLAALLGVNYNRSNRRSSFVNRIYSIQNNTADVNFDYNNEKYSTDILAGAMANFTLQLGANHKISFRNILNVNTTDYSTIRTGKDFETDPIVGDNIRATELAFKANTFFNTQIAGDHFIKPLKTKLQWYGSFNILDQHIPDQRRVQYNQLDPNNPNSPYSLLVSSSKTSQKSGSRYFGFLSDYNYTLGVNVSRSFEIGNQVHHVKAGYFFQVKDRLFDSRPFAIYLPVDNPTLRLMDQSSVFAPENFGNGFDNLFAFNEIFDYRYRYVANSILNAGFLQFDQPVGEKTRIVWGARLEHFDQVVGSMEKNDPRHVYSKKMDVLPGMNLTYKLNNKTNIRVSASQTVIRPEFRELSAFSFYDFDLGATVTGEPNLVRTKVTNADIRYELYPAGGEMFTVGVFYKYFKNPIELFFNQSGAGSSSTFNYLNATEASSYGAELEFRKKLDFNSTLKNFTAHGNVSYIYNRIPGLNRPMQGQSPYLLNLGLQYDLQKQGLSTTVLFNQIGRRIYYVGTASNSGQVINDNYPPVWEAPRAILDFQVSKKIIQGKGELRLNVSDILNQKAKFYHDLNGNKKYDKKEDALAIRRIYGTNISISFAYGF